MACGAGCFCAYSHMLQTMSPEKYVMCSCSLIWPNILQQNTSRMHEVPGQVPVLSGPQGQNLQARVKGWPVDAQQKDPCRWRTPSVVNQQCTQGNLRGWTEHRQQGSREHHWSQVPGPNTCMYYMCSSHCVLTSHLECLFREAQQIQLRFLLTLHAWLHARIQTWHLEGDNHPPHPHLIQSGRKYGTGTECMVSHLCIYVQKVTLYSSFRMVPMFGWDTIHRFSANVSDLSKLVFSICRPTNLVTMWGPSGAMEWQTTTLHKW